MKGKGFTLIEIEIAIVILLVCSLSITSLYVTGFVAFKKAKSITVARFLAQQKIEEIMEAISFQNNNLEDHPKTGSFPAPFSEYKFSFAIDNYEDSPFLKKVKVTVDGPENVIITLTSLKALQ